MLSPREAQVEILARVDALESSEDVPVDSVVGRVLAASAVSDLDLPPFEKSAMDGYAVHSADFQGHGERSLPIVGESRAGVPFTRAVPLGACVAIYTGAEVPADCDAVVMIEKTERSESSGADEVLVRDEPRAGQNVCHRGQDLAIGGTVLEPGHRVRAADVSVLAAVGLDPVPVVRRPRVAVLTTGDELVRPAEKPGPGQIREGNTLHLAALSRIAGADVVRVGILPDDPAELERAFGEALETCDALITTGGVSMGKYDLVGDTFERLGVENVFHKVRIKPGKPLWFGVRGATPVFALPGNPVSCLVGHAVFVRPALDKLSGERSAAGDPLRGRWVGPDLESNWRERYLPVARRIDAEGRLELAPVRWNGSGDVVGLSRADALARIPFDVTARTGDLVECLPLV